MKYKDMDDKQQKAFCGLLLNVVSIKSQEEQQYTQQFFRLLIIANGAGIALLTTFMGAVAGNDSQLAELVSPLITFLFGAISASLVFFPLVAVSNQATVRITNQVQEFFLNNLDVTEFQGYGFSRIGRLIVFILLFLSIVAFGFGVYQCIEILRGIE